MAEAPRNTQLPSGFDEEFVSEVEDDCLCVICKLPLKEPVLTRCGHRFCNACLAEHLRRQEAQNQPYTCPADRKSLDRDRDVFPDNATGRKILSMEIKCPSEGCSWTGELRDKEAHLKACPFKSVSCTNQNCYVTVKRKDLEQHVTNTCEWRIIECEYCEQQRPKKNLQIHLKTCSKIPLSCPNSCGNLIPREMISNHVKNDCPLSLVSCPYAQIGCIEKFQRKNVDRHLQSKTREHLDLACVKLTSTQVQLNETRLQLDETRAKLSRLTQDQLTNIKESQETKIEFEEKLEALQKQMYMMVKMNTDGKRGDTPFYWKIDSFYSEFMRQTKVIEHKTIESDPFYTTSYRYKLKVFVDLEYSAVQRAEFSIGIRLMEGEYDDILPWPFRMTTTFTVIDQKWERRGSPKNVVKKLSPTKENLSLPLFSKRPRGGSTADGRVERFTSDFQLQEMRNPLNKTLFLQIDVGPDANPSSSTPGSSGLPA